MKEGTVMSLQSEESKNRESKVRIQIKDNGINK